MLLSTEVIYAIITLWSHIIFTTINLGTEVATSRTVAIKKIKMGQFKDGMDLTAIREVKYLQEIRHPNVIEVWFNSFKAMHNVVNYY